MRTWSNILDRKLEQTPELGLEAVVLSTLAFMGTLDYLTGFEVAFSFFYLIPVSLAAWYGKKLFSYFVAALCAGTGQLANDLAGETHSHLLVTLWNDLIQLFVFLTVALLLRRLKGLLLKAQRMSQQDFLTGLPNKRALVERLESELARSSRQRTPLVLGFLDLDHFKRVNDERGHSEGDRLLYLVGETMQQALRRSDILARVGGDEFCVVLPGCSREAAVTVGEKLLGTISDLAAAEGWPISASLGLLHLEEARGKEEPESLLSFADSLMYEAKSEGRARFRLESI